LCYISALEIIISSGLQNKTIFPCSESIENFVFEIIRKESPSGTNELDNTNIYPPKILTYLMLQSDYSHYRPSSIIQSYSLQTLWLIFLPFSSISQNTLFFLVILGYILGLFLLTVSYSILFH